MIEFSDMPYVQTGQRFSLDLTALLHNFLTTDEIEEWKYGSHEMEIDDDLFIRTTENGTNIDDPYVDLYSRGAYLVSDGETVVIMGNDGQNIVRLRYEMDDVEFDMAYSNAYSCLNPID